MDWKKKVIIITGATTGIGKATRELLHSNGAIVYNLDISQNDDSLAHFI
jgi:NAD(P)-dependent dehydrogenase (short-subunit alcohol dehydrogenase family)